MLKWTYKKGKAGVGKRGRSAVGEIMPDKAIGSLSRMVVEGLMEGGITTIYSTGDGCGRVT